MIRCLIAFASVLATNVLIADQVSVPPLMGISSVPGMIEFSAGNNGHDSFDPSVVGLGDDVDWGSGNPAPVPQNHVPQNHVPQNHVPQNHVHQDPVDPYLVHQHPVHLPRQRSWLLLESHLTGELLDFQNTQTNKELLVLRHAGRPVGYAPSVVVGGQARLSALAAATNTENKFPYLGRFPTDFTGDTATDARLLQASAHATARVTPYATFYGELLFSDVFTFGDFRQGSLQVRQAYAVLGDLRVSPFYAYLGKKNIGFGDLETLSPFTQSVVWHYFAALGEGVGVGYHDARWDMTVAAINGGRGIRVNDSTEQGKLNNLAANITMTLGQSPDVRFRVGGGFLLGTIYDGFTAEHLDRSQFGTDYNSAWNLYSRVDLKRLTLSGEWISTTGSWPVTGSLVSAYRAEAGWWIDRGPQSSMVSASWSAGDQGPDGSEFEFNRQLVLGYQKQLSVNLRWSAEYVRSMGFAPLIDITTVSDRDVAQDSIVLGATLVL